MLSGGEDFRGPGYVIFETGSAWLAMMMKNFEHPSLPTMIPLPRLRRRRVGFVNVAVDLVGR
jgi:hypothetical protein